MSFLFALVGIALMVAVIAFVFSEDDTYIHPWDHDEDYDRETTGDPIDKL